MLGGEEAQYLGFHKILKAETTGYGKQHGKCGHQGKKSAVGHRTGLTLQIGIEKSSYRQIDDLCQMHYRTVGSVAPYAYGAVGPLVSGPSGDPVYKGSFAAVIGVAHILMSSGFGGCKVKQSVRIIPKKTFSPIS